MCFNKILSYNQLFPVVSANQQGVTQEMLDWFDRRTKFHINLVQKYLNKIMELNLPEVDKKILEEELNNHDASKLEEPEHSPYVHISWKYRQKDLGKVYNPPKEIEDQMHAATFHHVKLNKHHPEFWDENATDDVINTKNRDKPSGKMVDATKMPLSYIATMCADWLAMSEEKKTSVFDWIKNNVNIRWQFTPEQVSLINKIAHSLA